MFAAELLSGDPASLQKQISTEGESSSCSGTCSSMTINPSSSGRNSRGSSWIIQSWITSYSLNSSSRNMNPEEAVGICIVEFPTFSSEQNKKKYIYLTKQWVTVMACSVWISDLHICLLTLLTELSSTSIFVPPFSRLCFLSTSSRSRCGGQRLYGDLHLNWL